MRQILKDLYDRVVNNWESSIAALLVIIGIVEWKRQDITTEEFLTYVTGIASVIALLHKKK